MNIQRFHAPTARAALARARMAFGEDALILSNRSTAQGVEIVAASESALQQMGAPATPPGAASRPAPRPAPSLAPSPAAADFPLPQAHPDSSVQQDVAQLAMSTLSFQDYVRERMLRRRHDEGQASSADPVPVFTQAAPASPEALPARKKARHAFAATNPAPPAVGIQDIHALQKELRGLRQQIDERFNTLTWMGQARQSALHANLMHKLLRCGYSADLTRALLQNLPPKHSAAAQALRWLMQALQHNLRTAGDPGQDGGIHALIGPGGAGKTLAAHKLAARCVRQHGAASVGLITLGPQGSGMHLALHHSVRPLGLVAHCAHDRASLHDLLGLLANKRLVLIDTPGELLAAAQTQDARPGWPGQMLHDLLARPGVQPLVMLNAASQSETLDAWLHQLRRAAPRSAAPAAHLPALLSHADEAMKLAPALDACVRHRLLLRGVGCGAQLQWEAADAAQLVARSMRSSGRTPFDPQREEVAFFFTKEGDLQPAGSTHAA